MEVWIRSQDKQELIKVNGRFHIQETSVNPHSHIWGILVDGRDYYGEYKSEKRALEVLDEIQYTIEFINENPNGYYVKDNAEWNKHDKGTFMMPSNIYEMPKE